MKASRAGDFTEQARYYALSRPDYPPELVHTLLATTATPPGATVADLGAGTGISSRLLAAAGLHVIAVEPNAAMQAEAVASDGVRWQDGSFEATGLATASIDWCVAAQAFHWADVPRALPELHRALRPGGWFSVFWNDRETEASALLTETLATIRAIVPGYEERYRERDWASELVTGGWFGDVRPFELMHTVRMTRERYLNLWRSHNRLNASAGPERFPLLLARIDALVPAGEFDIPYRCRAWSVRRA